MEMTNEIMMKMTKDELLKSIFVMKMTMGLR